MKKALFFLMILPLGFMACKSNKHAKEIATIDSLYTVIDSIQKTLSTIDTVKIRKVVKEYTASISQIKENFKDENRKDEDLWKTITTYGIVKKPLRNFNRDFPAYYREIKFSRKQLDSLRADLKDGNIEEEKAPKYTKDEALAVNELKQKIESTVKVTQENLKLFDSLTPHVSKIIEELKKNGKQKSTVKIETEEDD
jgi:Skp family chaperone for outer membrane proteins